MSKDFYLFINISQYKHPLIAFQQEIYISSFVFYLYTRNKMRIWLVWATNVGKSTLFNRLIWQFRAIVTDIPGTTTDIIEHHVQTDSASFTFFDSPGLLDFTDELPYIEHIIQNSDYLLFLIDDTAGITAKEQHILDLIRKEEKQDQTLLIVNKLDVKRKESETELAISDYYTLWLANVVGISAKHERNLSTIESHINSFYTQRKKQHKDEEIKEEPFRVWLAILWKPNAGKSTLLNTLVWKPLAKVADVSGTTRDYVAWTFAWKWRDFIAYDTAWIKRRWKIHGIEKIAYDKTKAMLEFVRPIVIFMVDCTQWITHRDMTLLQEIHQLALPMIFVLNKVDQVNPKAVDTMIKNTQTYLDFAKYLPIVPMIATKWEWIDDVMKFVSILQKENTKRISTRDLNEALQHEMIQRPPRFPKNKICKILYATQIAVDAPTFIVFVNHKARANFAFKKWVENSIRKAFWFVWVPLVIKYRNRGESWKERDIFVKYNEKDVDNAWLEAIQNDDIFETYDEIEEGKESEKKGRRLEKKNNMGSEKNPYTNKWVRKREKHVSKYDEVKKTKSKQQFIDEYSQDWDSNSSNNNYKSWKKSSTHEAKKQKKSNQYSNIKKANQWKINAMFAEAYWDKNKEKKKRWK